MTLESRIRTLVLYIPDMELRSWVDRVSLDIPHRIISELLPGTLIRPVKNFVQAEVNSKIGLGFGGVISGVIDILYSGKKLLAKENS